MTARQVWFGRRPAVVLTDPELIRAASYKLASRPNFPGSINRGRLRALGEAGLLGQSEAGWACRTRLEARGGGGGRGGPLRTPDGSGLTADAASRLQTTLHGVLRLNLDSTAAVASAVSVGPACETVVVVWSMLMAAVAGPRSGQRKTGQQTVCTAALSATHLCSL